MPNNFFLDYHVKTAADFIENYIKVETEKFIPLQVELKKFFQRNKKFGKRDRLFISELCFSFFRADILEKDFSTKQKFEIGIFLLNRKWNYNEKKILSEFEEIEKYEFPFDFSSKISLLKSKYGEKYFNNHSVTNFFSTSIDTGNWLRSFFNEQFFFIRLRKDKAESVKAELKLNNILFKEIPNLQNCLAIASGHKIDALDSFLNGDFEIQDLSSQLLGNYYFPSDNERWLDACAASGGKSLLILEKNRTISLFATDIRPSILENYKSRLKKSRFSNFETETIDLSQNKLKLNYFDGIILDVPCSGSGTWKRSPESAYFFDDATMKHYTALQKKIIDNVLPSLKIGAQLIYSTCSVFQSENEAQIKYIEESHQLKLKEFSYFNNYENGSDWVFGARFVKEK